MWTRATPSLRGPSPLQRRLAVLAASIFQTCFRHGPGFSDLHARDVPFANVDQLTSERMILALISSSVRFPASRTCLDSCSRR